MKFKSEIVTQVSGSIGGTTYAHNRGGMYRRARSIPTNPNSASQQDVRSNFASLAVAWRETLTQAVRDGWSNYAANTPVTDSLGDPILLTGQQMYIRCNAPRLRAGLAAVTTFPVNMGLAELNGISASAPVDDVEIAFNNADAWASTDGGVLIIQCSRILAPSINFFRSPFRFMGVQLGDTMTPPTSPVAFSENSFGEVFAAQAPNVVFVRLVASQADGRLSPTQIHRVELA